MAGLDREQLADVLLQVYEAKKEARDFLDYFVDPDEQAALDKYKAIVVKEFRPAKGRAKRRVSVCRKAIKEFMVLQPSPPLVADLIVTYTEHLITYLVLNPYDSTPTQRNEFIRQLRFVAGYITGEGCAEEFTSRIDAILATVVYAGFGLSEEVSEFLKSGDRENSATPLATRPQSRRYRFFRRR